MNTEKFHWKNFKDACSYIEEQNFFEKEHDGALVEAWKRIFISRMYYYAFHSSVEVAESISKHIKDRSLRFEYDRNNAHTQIKKFYATVSSEYPLPFGVSDTFYKVSTELLTLHKIRKIADYDDEIRSDLSTLCNSSKLHSENIISLLERITMYFHNKFEK